MRSTPVADQPLRKLTLLLLLVGEDEEVVVVDGAATLPLPLVLVQRVGAIPWSSHLVFQSKLNSEYFALLEGRFGGPTNNKVGDAFSNRLGATGLPGMYSGLGTLQSLRYGRCGRSILSWYLARAWTNALSVAFVSIHHKKWTNQESLKRN